MFVLHCSIIIHAVCLCCIALLLYMQYVCVAFNTVPHIIESVDSICRDGADTPISPIQK